MTCEPRSPLTTTYWPRPALWPPNEACLSAPSSLISPAAASPLPSPPPPAMAFASSPYGLPQVPLPPIWSRPWAMSRRPLPIFRRTRRIFIVRGQRRVVAVPRRIVDGAFLSSPDDDASCGEHFRRGRPRGEGPGYNPPL